MMKYDEEGVPLLVQKWKVVKEASQAFFNIETGKPEFFNIIILEVTLFNNCRLELTLKNIDIRDISNSKIEFLTLANYTLYNENFLQKMLFKYSYSPVFAQEVFDKTRNDPDRFYFGKLDYT